MPLITAVIYGIVQGLTEFLPISSSGHLVILHEILPLDISGELAFDVALHLATLLAVICYFRRDIAALLAHWCKWFGGERSGEAKVGWAIILATIPAAAAGWLWGDYLESSLRSVSVVIVTLIAVGILLLAAERISGPEKEMDGIGKRSALIIGVAQATALIPGTSRSGITIVAGLFIGLKKEAAVKFSFLLSIPIIAGAGLKELPALFSADWEGKETALLAVAFVFSFLSGYAAVKYLLLFVQRRGFAVFAVYRFILAAVLAAYFWL